MFIRNALLFLIGLGMVLFSSPLFVTKQHDVIKFPYKYGEKFGRINGLESIVRLVDPVASSSCTAFIIDAHYAITAAHCLNHNGVLPTYLLYVFPNNMNKFISARAAGYDTHSDVGVIIGDFSMFKSIVIDLDHEITGKHHIACGYGRGTKRLICNNYYPKDYMLDQVKGKGQFFHGMSGGPIINDDGAAVAIVDAIDEDGWSYVVPLQGLFGIFPGLE